MSLFFADGKKWLENKAKKIEKFLENKHDKKEGYRGIMGPINSIDSMNTNDFEQTNNISNNLAQGINDYTTKYNELSSATTAYLGMTAQYDENKNYNIFINSPMDSNSIIASPYSRGKCIANGTEYSALAGLTNASPAFDSVYPGNFPNTPAGTALAMNACKLWAADSQVPSFSIPDNTYFALTKDANNKFKCYTGRTLYNSNPAPYVVKKIAYKIASSNDSTRGGLFQDGTIGVYNENIPLTGPADTANPYNIQTPFVAPITSYIKCDKWGGGAVNPKTINATLGLNCSNVNGTPVNMRYIYVKRSSTSPNGWPFIQISQLAVFAIENGASKNVANRFTNNKAVAISGNGPSYTNTTNASWNNNSSPPHMAIDGNLSARPHPQMYHSPENTTKDEWWRVDLGKEYPVYEIVYYNRQDCCWDRAIGMAMQFRDDAGNFVSVKDPVSGNATQTITIPTAALEQRFTISKP